MPQRARAGVSGLPRGTDGHFISDNANGYREASPLSQLE
jgi:hypothetical protein